MTWLYNSSILFFRYGRHIFFWKNITYLYIKIFRYLNNFWGFFFKSMLGELNMLHVTVFPYSLFLIWKEISCSVFLYDLSPLYKWNIFFLHLYSFNERNILLYGFKMPLWQEKRVTKDVHWNTMLTLWRGIITTQLEQHTTVLIVIQTP